MTYLSRTQLGILLFAILVSGQYCTSIDSTPKMAPAVAEQPFNLAALPAADPNMYWYQGKAELATYTVQQERYGQMRQAEQVMVFVTEDLSKSKQVKLDDAASAGTDRLPVLKINTLRKFKTGIYDYSLMQSVFTPMDGGPTAKVTTTVQDWCGHVFSQFNLDPKGGYRARIFSYFETESDTDIHLPAVMLEDEIWTRIRLGNIKQGAVEVIPSAFYTRMRHKPTQVEKATITVVEKDGMHTTTLQYTELPRSLTIVSESKFPYRIAGWEERDGDKMMSKGTLQALRLEPYWSENGHQFDGMRDSLKLDRL